jgi:regulation of enolase protein 1 (concanavalin A-like superfamily)
MAALAVLIELVGSFGWTTQPSNEVHPATFASAESRLEYFLKRARFPGVPPLLTSCLPTQCMAIEEQHWMSALPFDRAPLEMIMECAKRNGLDWQTVDIITPRRNLKSFLTRRDLTIDVQRFKTGPIFMARTVNEKQINVASVGFQFEKAITTQPPEPQHFRTVVKLTLPCAFSKSISVLLSAEADAVLSPPFLSPTTTTTTTTTAATTTATTATVAATDVKDTKTATTAATAATAAATTATTAATTTTAAATTTDNGAVVKDVKSWLRLEHVRELKVYLKKRGNKQTLTRQCQLSGTTTAIIGYKTATADDPNRYRLNIQQMKIKPCTPEVAKKLTDFLQWALTIVPNDGNVYRISPSKRKCTLLNRAPPVISPDMFKLLLLPQATNQTASQKK